MKISPVSVSCPDGSTIEVGTERPLLLIAGPCVLESEELGLQLASTMQEICDRLGISYVFKASFDKANRTSISSFRGPGLEQGLAYLARIRQKLGVPVISDIHEPNQAQTAAEVLDIIQIPAFLCRQTDLLTAASATGKPINLKKGQFVSPWEMKNGVNKIRSSGASQVMLVERGASFGYNNLVVDMRGLPVMQGFDCPVIYDATHSVQQPGGQGTTSGGERQFVPVLARAAVAVGVAGLFIETHDEPEKSPSDGPNMVPLNELESLLRELMEIDQIAKKRIAVQKT